MKSKILYLVILLVAIAMSIGGTYFVMNNNKNKNTDNNASNNVNNNTNNVDNNTKNSSDDNQTENAKQKESLTSFIEHRKINSSANSKSLEVYLNVKAENSDSLVKAVKEYFDKKDVIEYKTGITDTSYSIQSITLNNNPNNKYNDNQFPVTVIYDYYFKENSTEKENMKYIAGNGDYLEGYGVINKFGCGIVERDANGNYELSTLNTGGCGV